MIRLFKRPSATVAGVFVGLLVVDALHVRQGEAEEITIHVAASSSQLPIIEALAERYAAEVDGNAKFSIKAAESGLLRAKIVAAGQYSDIDIVWGMASSDLGELAERDLLAETIPPGDYKLNAELEKVEEQIQWNIKSGDSYSWFPTNYSYGVICFNEKFADLAELPVPQTWEDLAQPIYGGSISMPNPVSSGVGYQHIAQWLSKYTDEKGRWNFVDKLDENVEVYTTSSGAPCELAANGLIPIGISSFADAELLKEKGVDVGMLVPEGEVRFVEGAGVIDRQAVVSTLAQAFLGWAVTQESLGEFDTNDLLVAQEAMLAGDIDDVLEEWQLRYDAKSTTRF